ncbi:MAG: DNA polymerase [Acidimicrobiales bacterium]
MADLGASVVEELRGIGVGRGDLVALALAPKVGLGLTPGGGSYSLAVRSEGDGDDDAGGPVAVVRRVEEELRPRWVLWSHETALTLVRSGLRVVTCWDILAVHRLLFGESRADPARVWARLHDLPLDTLPATAARPLDLFSQADDGDSDPDTPVRADGHVKAAWLTGRWADTPERMERWAELGLQAAALQARRLAELHERPRAAATARSESAAELLCAELSVDGLPMDRSVAEHLVAGFVGPRPRTESEAAQLRARRDDEVLRHAPTDGQRFDLRSPGQVRSLLRRVGIEVADTRAWRLEALRVTHPVVDALLAWRKAERVATTYGYAWLDENLDADGRLRGTWTGSDGAAGRMTASAGLHNMPAGMRAAVAAEAGHVLVRADLGQIEPRVLAAVSGDEGLRRATRADDMYAPLARDLGVDRETAKVAMLGAMYGQTTGHGAQVVRRLTAAYPVAMAYLEDGDRSGQAGRDLHTYGGRLVRMGPATDDGISDQEARSRAAARGRYGRNALVQGAAAELFKVWAVTVRARGAALAARIVLCLHDELLVHVPTENGPAAAQLVEDCLREAARRWVPDDSVRFVADISVIQRWSDAKA